MNNYQRNDGGDAGQMVTQILLAVLSILFGVFVISQWLTRLFLQYVLNPLLDGLLDREDGAVVLISSLLWGVVAGLVLFPVLWGQDAFGPTPPDMISLWLGTIAAGLLWGIAVGVWVLGTWWNEAERQMPAGYDVVHLLDTPIEIHSPAPRPAQDDDLPSGGADSG